MEKTGKSNNKKFSDSLSVRESFFQNAEILHKFQKLFLTETKMQVLTETQILRDLTLYYTQKISQMLHVTTSRYSAETRMPC